MLSNNIAALVITFLLAVGWLRINDFAAHRNWISSDLSRKIIHMGTGPLFVICWLLFNNSPSARFLAALVPLAITLQFILVGAGILRDESAVQAMSRTGDRREILRGPLYYGIIFVLLTILYWRYSPVGIIALMLLCGGDGLADVLGRRFGKAKIPWNSTKTWVGSLAMFFGGWVFAAAILAIYIGMHVFPGNLISYLPGLTLIALAGAVVETLPLDEIDNITVSLTAVVLGTLIFKS